MDSQTHWILKSRFRQAIGVILALSVLFFILAYLLPMRGESTGTVCHVLQTTWSKECNATVFMLEIVVAESAQNLCVAHESMSCFPRASNNGCWPIVTNDFTMVLKWVNASTLPCTLNGDWAFLTTIQQEDHVWLRVIGIGVIVVVCVVLICGVVCVASCCLLRRKWNVVESAFHTRFTNPPKHDLIPSFSDEDEALEEEDEKEEEI